MCGSSTFVYETTIEVSGSYIRKYKFCLKYVCVCACISRAYKVQFELYYYVVVGSR